MAGFNFTIPSTRYLGSKARLLPWMYESFVGMDFSSVLDVFGGTASVSYMFKALGKEVYFNDLLRFNQDIATAMIENKNVMITNDDIKIVLKSKPNGTKKIIQDNFHDIYFNDSENKWVDQTVQNIYMFGNKYKRAILLAALYQACLIKRPFNLFHRKNLYLRTNEGVERSFGNKVTWDRPFRLHFLKFIKEYNNSVFDNGRENKVIGGYDALRIPRKSYDLVYLDPPYLSKKSSVNYLDCYHFLEGLSGYEKWETQIDHGSNNKKMLNISDIDKFIDEERVYSLFKRLFHKFRNSSIVMAYRNDGIPSLKQIKFALTDATGKEFVMKTREYKYALSNGSTKEVLFIAH